MKKRKHNFVCRHCGGVKLNSVFHTLVVKPILGISVNNGSLVLEYGVPQHLEGEWIESYRCADCGVQVNYDDLVKFKDDGWNKL